PFYDFKSHSKLSESISRPRSYPIDWWAGAETLSWGLLTIGAGLLTAVSGTATSIAMACPADGPVGDVALGAATLQSATWTAGAATATGYSAFRFWHSLWN